MSKFEWVASCGHCGQEFKTFPRMPDPEAFAQSPGTHFRDAHPDQIPELVLKPRGTIGRQHEL